MVPKIRRSEVRTQADRSENACPHSRPSPRRTTHIQRPTVCLRGETHGPGVYYRHIRPATLPPIPPSANRPHRMPAPRRGTAVHTPIKPRQRPARLPPVPSSANRPHRISAPRRGTAAHTPIKPRQQPATLPPVPSSANRPHRISAPRRGTAAHTPIKPRRRPATLPPVPLSANRPRRMPAPRRGTAVHTPIKPGNASGSVCNAYRTETRPRPATPTGSRGTVYPDNPGKSRKTIHPRRFESGRGEYFMFRSRNPGIGNAPDYFSFFSAFSIAAFRAASPAMSPRVVFSTEALIFFTVDFVASAAARFSAFSAAASALRASS